MSTVRIIEPWSGAGLLLSALAASCSSPGHAPLVLESAGNAGLQPGSVSRSPLPSPSSGERKRRGETEPGWSPAFPAESARARQQLPDPDANYRADFYAREGVYLSARSHWSSLGGDFDGDTMLQAGPPSNEVITIPEADDGYGYELALGWISKGWAMELSYTDITYDGSIGAASADVDYGAISWNGIRYLRANEPLQPYFMLGFLFSWADLEDASMVGLTTADAELEYGFGIDGGVGLAWWLGHNLALDVRALAVYQEFEEADGVSVSGSIDDPVEGPSFGLSVGLTWVLGKPDGDEP